MDKLNLKPARSIAIVGSTCILLSLAGCVKESVDGDTITYTNELWVSLAAFFGGIAGGVIGWFVRNASARFGWGLMIGGFLSAFMFAPSLFMDRATVNPERFTIRTGILGLTSRHDVPFEGLQRIRITMEESRGRRGRKKENYYLICESNGGQQTKVPLSNDVSQSALEAIAVQAVAHGIDLQEEL